MSPDVSAEDVGEAAVARSERLEGVEEGITPFDAPEGADRTLAPPSMVELVRHAREIRALLADPAVSASQRRQLMELEAEVVALQQEAAIRAQRAESFARVEAARAARAERVRVHPSSHPGPCPMPGEMWVNRADVQKAGAGHLHLDVDQVAPSWWPRGAPRFVDASPLVVAAGEHRELPG